LNADALNASPSEGSVNWGVRELSELVPPPAYAPLPVVPVRLNVVGVRTMIENVPFAAVLPVTPDTVTLSPVA